MKKRIPMKAFAAAITIGVVAMIALVTVHWPKWKEEWAKDKQANLQTRQVANSVIKDAKDGKIDDLAVKLDAWGHPLNVAVNFGDDKTDIEISSAGADGEMGTSDDIVVVKEKKKRGWVSRLIWGSDDEDD